MLLKSIKKVKAFILATVLGLGFLTSCGSDDDTPTLTFKEDIVEIVSADNNLSILVQALQKANLVSDLKADGTFTVFAPTNEAFQALLDSNSDWNTLDDIPVVTLEAILLYHVSSTYAPSQNLSDNQELTTLYGEVLTTDLSSGVKIESTTNQSVSVTKEDMFAKNGVIHVINEVLIPAELPKDIVGLIGDTPDLSMLATAIQRANLTATLQAKKPFTIFAPNNASFQALLDSNSEWNTLDDIPVDMLTSILSFHVVSGMTMSTDLSDTYLNTLAVGGDEVNNKPLSLQIQVTGEIKFNGEAKIVEGNKDIRATNGVVHIIDKVMELPTVLSLLSNNPEFASFFTAISNPDPVTVEFIEILSGDKSAPFTIFAPTNEAFQALLNSNSEWNSLNDIPLIDLDVILAHHFIFRDNIQADQLTDGQELSTTEDEITIDLTSGIQIKTSSSTMQTINVLVGAATNDIQGVNGVIHTVDTVLLLSAVDHLF